MRGGFGRRWAKPGEPPTIERGDPIPTDETEETNRQSLAVGSEISSRWSAIKALHPDWPDSEVDKEIGRIMKEAQDFSASAQAALGGVGGDALEEGGADNTADSDMAEVLAALQGGAVAEPVTEEPVTQ